MLRISHAKELSKSLRFVDGFTPRKVIGGKGGNSGIVDGTHYLLPEKLIF